MLVMSSCSREKPDSVFMNGLPESGFTIDYTCFLNQDIKNTMIHSLLNTAIQLRYMYQIIKGVDGL